MKKTLTFLALGALLASGYQGRAQYLEDFESTTGTALPTGWIQNVVPNDSTGWLSGTNTTLASTSFSPNAHTRFICVNDDKHLISANGNSFVTSASFTVASTLVHPYLSFDCSFLGGHTNTTPDTAEVATVEISTDNGTTWTVISTLTGNTQYWWEPRYISLAGVAGLTTSANVKVGFRYKDGGSWMYGWAIDNVKVYDPPNDMALTSIAPYVGTPANYAAAGSNVTMTGTVFNYSATTVTTYNINYLFNGGTIVSSPIAASVAPFSVGTFSAPTPITMPTTLGAYPLRAWITMTGDVNPLNDTSGKDTLISVAFMPHKTIFFEEPTGTWCGWCVRGIVYMDSINQLHRNDVSIASVHNGDPMQADNASSSAYDTYMGTLISGYPSLIVDRDPAAGDPSSAFNAYNAMHNWFGFADMGVNTVMTASGMQAIVGVNPAIALNGDYRLELIVTEDNVHGTGTTWQQHNYYSGGGSGAMSWGPYNFATLPGTIPATTMFYDFVARTTYPTDLSANPTGVAGSLPTTMTPGNSYYYTFPAISLASNWITNKLTVIALLIDNNPSSPFYQRVLNSTHSGFPVGVSNVSAGVEGVRVFPNPATEDANVVFDLKENSNVAITVFDAVGRVVYTLPAQQMNGGEQHLSIPVDGFATGVYNMVITTGNGKVTERFTVAR